MRMSRDYIGNFYCNIMFTFVDIMIIIYLGDYSRYSKGKGVLKENDGHSDNSVDIIYYKEKKTGFGVRNDNLVYYCQLNDRATMLMYDKPCLCGSLTHRTTRDPRCLLSVQYVDAIE